MNTTNLAVITGVLPFADMEKTLLAKMEVTDGDLNLLAADRAKKVKEFLLEKGQISPERLFVTDTAGQATTNRASRVYLQLK